MSVANYEPSMPVGTATSLPVGIEEPNSTSLESLYWRVQEAGRIHDAMSIDKFLNLDQQDCLTDMPTDMPAMEPEALLESLLENYISPTVAEEEVDDEEEEPPVAPTGPEVLEMLSQMIDYTEIASSCFDASNLKELECMQRRLKDFLANQLQQSTLDSWCG